MPLDLISILFLSIWLYSEARMIRYKNHTVSDDFELSSEDQATLQQARIDSADAHRKHSRSEAKIKQIRKSGANLRRNKDGTYDRRSKLGKKLNRELPLAESEFYNSLNAISFSHGEQKRLENKPKDSAIKWVKLCARRDSNRVNIMICGSFVFLILLIGMQPEDYWYGILFIWIALGYTLYYIFCRNMKRSIGV